MSTGLKRAGLAGHTTLLEVPMPWAARHEAFSQRYTRRGSHIERTPLRDRAIFVAIRRYVPSFGRIPHYE